MRYSLDTKFMLDTLTVNYEYFMEKVIFRVIMFRVE